MSEFTEIHDPIWRDCQRSARAGKKQAIRERIKQAVAAERESCAKLTDALGASVQREDIAVLFRRLADDMRARGKK